MMAFVSMRNQSLSKLLELPREPGERKLTCIFSGLFVISWLREAGTAGDAYIKHVCPRPCALNEPTSSLRPPLPWEPWQAACAPERPCEEQLPSSPAPRPSHRPSSDQQRPRRPRPPSPPSPPLLRFFSEIAGGRGAAAALARRANRLAGGGVVGGGPVHAPQCHVSAACPSQHSRQELSRPEGRVCV